MKHLIPFVFLSAVVMMTSACKEKPESNIIIAKKETQKKIPTGPKKMSDYTMNKMVDWADSRYSIYIQRVADESQPMVKDEQGNEYYDNVISLKVVRADGSTFFERKFKKEDFREFTNNPYGKNGALLGIVFDKAEADNLFFAASIGSPDALSDEYIPLVLSISRMGDVHIKKDTQLDTGNNKPMDELEAAEAEGM